MAFLSSDCLFCKIIQGTIPSYKLVETDLSYSFLDIGPLSRGHALVIPKHHGEKLHDIPDDFLQDSMIVAKKIAVAQGFQNYNILQNNGSIAHQVVKHVHFHVIPKPEEDTNQGLVIGWPQQTPTKEELQKVHEEIKAKI